MEQLKKPSHSTTYLEILPLHPLSPRPKPIFYQHPEPRPRSSSLNRNEQSNPVNREINTMPEGTHQKEFVIKSSKERRTPVKRRITPSKQQLQNLFKIVDQDEEKDFLDLIGHLK